MAHWIKPKLSSQHSLSSFYYLSIPSCFAYISPAPAAKAWPFQNMPGHFLLNILQPGCSFGLENQTFPSQPIQTLLKVQIKSKLFHEVSLDITTTNNKWHSYIPCIITHLCMLAACLKTANSLQEVDKVFFTEGGETCASLSPNTILPHPSAQSGGSVNTRWTNEHSFLRHTSTSTKQIITKAEMSLEVFKNIPVCLGIDLLKEKKHIRWPCKADSANFTNSLKKYCLIIQNPTIHKCYLQEEGGIYCNRWRLTMYFLPKKSAVLTVIFKTVSVMSEGLFKSSLTLSHFTLKESRTEKNIGPLKVVTRQS